jgi:guanylate kinase
MSQKRVILCGPAASGKTYIKNKFIERGFEPEVTYTTRPQRAGEVQDRDYHFISENEFFNRMTGVTGGGMYETAKHGDYWYGTSLAEWDNSEIFIMETHGISQISSKDRKNCLIIYVNTPVEIRFRRM